MPFSAGRELFVELNRPSRLRLFIFDLVRGIGCVARAAGYYLKSWVDRGAAVMWRDKARTFLAYAFDSFSHLRHRRNIVFPQKKRTSG